MLGKWYKIKFKSYHLERWGTYLELNKWSEIVGWVTQLESGKAGLIAACCPWGYLQLNPDKKLT